MREYTHVGWAHRQWVRTTHLTRKLSQMCLVLLTQAGRTSGLWISSPTLYPLSHPVTLPHTRTTVEPHSYTSARHVPVQPVVPDVSSPLSTFTVRDGVAQLVQRASDSRSKGPRFESRQSQMKNLWVVSFYLFIYLLKAHSTAQGHLRALQKFKSHTSWTRHKTRTL